jgi:hypothetical protein
MANCVFYLVDPDAEWNLQPYNFGHTMSRKTKTVFHLRANSMFAQHMLADNQEAITPNQLRKMF